MHGSARIESRIISRGFSAVNARVRGPGRAKTDTPGAARRPRIGARRA